MQGIICSAKVNDILLKVECPVSTQNSLTGSNFDGYDKCMTSLDHRNCSQSLRLSFLRNYSNVKSSTCHIVLIGPTATALAAHRSCSVQNIHSFEDYN